MQVKSEADNKKISYAILGSVGGLFIHLIVGSIYQWGIINIYITSYYKLSDSSMTLQQNAIAFPAMFGCVGLTMRLGLFLAEKTHPLIIMSVNTVLLAACIFIASYVDSIGAFIAFYGIIFGLLSGINFMIPIFQTNHYYTGKRMYINGMILVGTGLGPVIFGMFSYSFLNSERVDPLQGYYVGTSELETVVLKVPECLRWLALFYIIIGWIGVGLLTPVCLANRKRRIEIDDRNHEQNAENNQQNISKQRILLPETNVQAPRVQQKIQSNDEQVKDNPRMSTETKKGTKLPPLRLPFENSQQKQKNQIQYGDSTFKQQQTKFSPEKKQINQVGEKINQQPQQDKKPKGQASSLKEAFCSFVCWYQVFVLLFASCGVFLINGNYKTYVKQEIKDDYFLTIIGIVGAVGNGVSRFFWNLLFSKTGYKTVLILNLSIQIIVYSTIRFTVYYPQAYLVLVFLINCCLGGILVIGATVTQVIFGHHTGSNIYGFYWQIFSVANFIQFAYVSGLSQTIGFQAIIYICLGMAGVAMILVIAGKFQGPWQNSIESLRYCSECC